MISQTFVLQRSWDSTKMLLVLLLLASGSTAAAQDTNGVMEADLGLFIENKSKVVKLKKEELQDDLKKANLGKVDKRTIEDVVKEKINRGYRYQFKSKESKDVAIAKIEAELNAIENESNLLPLMPFEPHIAVGNVGRLIPRETYDENGYDHRYTVLQVLDGNSSIIKWKTTKYIPAVIPKVNGFGGGRPGYSEEDEMMIWLNGSTEGWTDGRRVDIGGTYKVTSTKTYRSSIGTNTVFVLEKFDASDYLAKAKRAVAK